MTSAFRNCCSPRLGLAFGVVLLSGWVMAADKPQAAPQEGTPVEMFAAIESGQINVRLIPKDATQCRVLIENKTDQPLSVKLPEAFAGVPVLAQFGGGRMGGGGMGGMGGGGMGVGGGGGGQSIGGGMGGMGGMGGGGMGGGMFNIAPEKVGQLKVPTVCLEHGKPDPNPRMTYEIRPIEQFTDKPAVQELCRMLGKGQVPQRAAQVAAWHLQDNMSFETLAAKRRFVRDPQQPYFDPQEIRDGMAAVSMAKQLAAQHQQSANDTSTSLHQP